MNMSLRVAILGVGGVGRTLALELRNDPRIEALLLVDKAGDRARVLAGIHGRPSIEARELNVENRPELIRVLRGYDITVNATLPKFNVAVMQAALEAGTDYLDTMAAGPREPGTLPGILEQLALHESFRAAGRTALVSMGLDPGMTNVMARAASDALDTIDAVRIRVGGLVVLPGFATFPMYSREAFLSDILLRPTVWLDGRLEDREPLSEEEDYAFPAPIGTRRAFLLSHEEVKTLPRFLGKPVRRVDFKYALDPTLFDALNSLHKLGLLKENRTVRVGPQTLPFRQALLAAFPEPSALVQPLDGTHCVSVEVEGTVGGTRKVHRSDIVFSHREANRRRSTTAVDYLVAMGAAVGITLLGERCLPGPGVFPAEALDPTRVLREWKARNLPFDRSERIVTG